MIFRLSRRFSFSYSTPGERPRNQGCILLGTLCDKINLSCCCHLTLAAGLNSNKKAGRYSYLPACFIWWRCGGSRAFAYANPHRLRPAIAVLARSLKTLRVFFTLAPCIEFDSPQGLTAIKKQVDIHIYLLVSCGGADEKNGEHRRGANYRTRYGSCESV